MKPDIIKIKNATTKELIDQYNLAEQEIQNDNEMNPNYYTRFTELENYKTAIYEELKSR